MNVRRSVRYLGLHADKTAGDVASIENPIHSVTGEDVGDLLLGGKDNQCRLKQAGVNHRRRVRFGHGDGTWRVRLKRMRLYCVARCRDQRKSGRDYDGYEWFHGTGPFSREF